jgi:hypothetical protein
MTRAGAGWQVLRRGGDHPLIGLADGRFDDRRGCGQPRCRRSRTSRVVRLGDPSRTRQDGRIGVAPVKVGPSACASRTADAAPLTAAQSDTFSQRGPGWTWRGRTPTPSSAAPRTTDIHSTHSVLGTKSSQVVPGVTRSHRLNSRTFPPKRAAIEPFAEPASTRRGGQDVQDVPQCHRDSCGWRRPADRVGSQADDGLTLRRPVDLSGSDLVLMCRPSPPEDPAGVTQ